MCVTASYRAGKEVLIKSIQLLVPCHLWLIISLIRFIIFTVNGNSCSATTGSRVIHTRNLRSCAGSPSSGFNNVFQRKRGTHFIFWGNSLMTVKSVTKNMVFKGVKCLLVEFLIAETQRGKAWSLILCLVLSTRPSASKTFSEVTGYHGSPFSSQHASSFPQTPPQFWPSPLLH